MLDDIYKEIIGKDRLTPLMWWKTRRSMFPGFWLAIRRNSPTGSANLILLTKL